MKASSFDFLENTSGVLAGETLATNDLAEIDGMTGKAVKVDVADFAAGSITLTMPLNPTIGDSLAIKDRTNSWLKNNVMLSRNGQNFVNASGSGVAEDFTLNLSNVELTLIFTASGWRAI